MNLKFIFEMSSVHKYIFDVTNGRHFLSGKNFNSVFIGVKVFQIV